MKHRVLIGILLLWLPAAGAVGIDKDALDTKTRPQDDFYQFANGRWLQNTLIPPAVTGVTQYSRAYDSTEQALKKIIESALQQQTPGSPQHRIANLYGGWMDKQAIEKVGVDALRPELELINGITSPTQLVSAMVWLDKRDIKVPFTLYVQPDLSSPDSNLLYLHQSGLTLPARHFYLQVNNPNLTNIRTAYQMYVSQMLGMLSPQLQQSAAAVIDLEHQLAGIQADIEDHLSIDRTYNPYPFSQLSKISPVFPWLGLEQLHGYTQQINIDQPYYIQGLATLLTQVPLDTWKAYLRFRVLDSRAMHLPARFDQLHHLFYGTIISGQQHQKLRWRRGISLVSELLSQELGALYVKDYFDTSTRERVEKMFEHIRAAAMEHIQQSQWMQLATRQEALAKLAQMQAKIGFPDHWRDYSGLTLDATQHMSNVRSAALYNNEFELAQLALPVDRQQWFVSPQTVNAFYNPTANEIVFPAARLQPPFFVPEADAASNYGSLGSVIGHEISHAFDRLGSRFDGQGRLREWWSDDDRLAYQQRTQGLAVQFNQYEVLPGVRIDGNRTLNENLGDLAGLRLAFDAWKYTRQGQSMPDKQGFTPAQRFFISYAQMRRGKLTEASLLSRTMTDVHAPLRYRVNGVLINMPEFYQVFGVKPGDKLWLNPEQRISVW